MKPKGLWNTEKPQGLPFRDKGIPGGRLYAAGAVDGHISVFSLTNRNLRGECAYDK